jgi:predicted HTH transcriptional regulator
MGKKGSTEKEYIAHASYVTLVVSLKTLNEKTRWEKVTKEKSTTTNLQD